MKKLGVLILFILAAGQILSQSNLEYNFEKGKSYIYLDVTKSDVTQEMMGQEMKVQSTIRTVTRMTSEDNSDKGITLIISIDSAVSHTRSPQIDTTINLTDMIDKKMKVTISKYGSIISKEMIDSVNLEGMQIGRKDEFARFPEEEIKEGDTWSTTNVDTLNIMGGSTIMTSEIKYTLSGKEEKAGYSVRKIPFSSTIKIEGGGNLMGFQFVLEGSGTSSGAYYFNEEKGIPVQTEAEQVYDITMAATGDQNMIIPINQQVKTTRTLVE